MDVTMDSNIYAAFTEYMKTHTAQDLDDDYRQALEENEKSKRDWESVQENGNLVKAHIAELTKKKTALQERIKDERAKLELVKAQIQTESAELSKMEARLENEQKNLPPPAAGGLTAEEAEAVEIEQLKRIARLDDEIEQWETKRKDAYEELNSVVNKIHEEEELQSFIQIEMQSMITEQDNCQADIDRYEKEINALQNDIKRQEEALTSTGKKAMDCTSLFDEVLRDKKTLEDQLKAAVERGNQMQSEIRHINSQISALQSHGHNHTGTGYDMNSVRSLMDEFETKSSEILKTIRLCHTAHIDTFKLLEPIHQSELSDSFRCVFNQLCRVLDQYNLQLTANIERFNELKARLNAVLVKAESQRSRARAEQG